MDHDSSRQLGHDTVDRDTASARARLATGRNWLADLETHAELVVRPHEVTVQLVMDLALVTRREVALFRMANGERVLMLGSAHPRRIPKGKVVRCLLHSHPGGGLVFSRADIEALITYSKDGNGRPSSIIVVPYFSERGRVPVQRLNARENEAGSEKPTR